MSASCFNCRRVLVCGRERHVACVAFRPSSWFDSLECMGSLFFMLVSWCFLSWSSSYLLLVVLVLVLVHVCLRFLFFFPFSCGAIAAFVHYPFNNRPLHTQIIHTTIPIDTDSGEDVSSVEEEGCQDCRSFGDFARNRFIRCDVGASVVAELLSVSVSVPVFFWLLGVLRGEADRMISMLTVDINIHKYCMSVSSIPLAMIFRNSDLIGASPVSFRGTPSIWIGPKMTVGGILCWFRYIHARLSLLLSV